MRIPPLFICILWMTFSVACHSRQPAYTGNLLMDSTESYALGYRVIRQEMDDTLHFPAWSWEREHSYAIVGHSLFETHAGYDLGGGKMLTLLRYDLRKSPDPDTGLRLINPDDRVTIGRYQNSGSELPALHLLDDQLELIAPGKAVTRLPLSENLDLDSVRQWVETYLEEAK